LLLLYPAIDSRDAIPPTKRLVVTVVHRFGDTRNRSFPYSASFDVHVGFAIEKLAAAFVSFRYTAPPFPFPDVGAMQETNVEPVTFSFPADAPPPRAP
jgi:hypothetical protein